MAWCAPSRHRSKTDESNRVQIFHYDANSSDSYSDTSDYVEQNAPSSSLLSRVFKPKKHWQDAAVQVYKRQHKGKLYIHKVRLQSPQLKDALKELLEPYGVVYRNDGVMAESLAPHRALYFVRHHVAELAKMSDDDMTRAHCTLLSDIIQEIFRDKFDEIETLNREEKITFELLWTLFPEGSTFGTHLADEVPRAYKVNKVLYDKEKADIKCETIMFNGYCFRRYLWNFKILKFDGEVGRLQIPLLPYIDLEHKRDLRERLIERGKKALDFQSPRYMEYDPEDCREDALSGPWVAKGIGKTPEKQKVVVDFFLVRKRTKYTVPYASLPGYGKGTRMAAKQFRRPTQEEMNTNRRVVLESEENLLIMSPYVSGFGLSSRTFCDFEIDALRPVERDEDAMKKIVFDEKKKETVKTLVEGHRQLIQSSAGRSRPLVILTVGTTGTGKTLMAECLAAYTGSPLLKDWTSVAETFEEARDWGACILVERQWGVGPLQLRASDFAKQLDNFKGIVIVSSPSKGTIPYAITSRAQIHINLPPLGMLSRLLIWERFNDQLPSDVGKLPPAALERAASETLTGHDIRNTVDVAVTWCRAQNQQISFEVIKKLRADAGGVVVLNIPPGVHGHRPPMMPGMGFYPPSRPTLPPGSASNPIVSRAGPSAKKDSSDSDGDDKDDGTMSQRTVTTISSDDDDKVSGSVASSSEDEA
ncbi:hypothetical protein B0T21DRAFT_382515 [Apiosordaria backusii]|uniref:DUF7025 domain-containing protein n=1 Tax=Apiosordaria backusii TaxID=314023 RepID=A0AA40BSI9_9PEZI|nr:hypothetical protein B0T21DRAFT_382515 [Apiosordaria backusii]